MPTTKSTRARKGPEKPAASRRCAEAAGSVKQRPVITDSQRMDYLVRMNVEVRTPLLYGSHALFHAQTVSDIDEEHRTSLREQIDRELLSQNTELRNAAANQSTPDSHE